MKKSKELESMGEKVFLINMVIYEEIEGPVLLLARSRNCSEGKNNYGESR